MPLFLDTGFSVRTANQDGGADSCLAIVPNEDIAHPHGALFAVADGIAERPEPESAARDALKALGDSYYAAPESWPPGRALRESLAAANHSLLTQGERGRAAVLSALALRHRRWWMGHAGDTRVWLLRDHRLKLLTRDHVTPRMGGRPLPNRACGLDADLDADHATGELAEGDIFVLTAGGVHDVLDGAHIMSCLLVDSSTKQMADCLTGRAVSAGGRGNVTACVVRVEKLPGETASDIAENLAHLPVITPPEPGAVLDRFRIEALIHKSRLHRLYRALDEDSGSRVVLKFPNPRLARAAGFADAFLREEWIGKRIDNPNLVKTLPMRPGRRSALYSTMSHVGGDNLHERIRRKRRLSVSESLAYGAQLLEALESLHRHGVVHGDVRAKNIVVDKKKGQLYLLGLGTSQVDTLGEMTQGPTVPKSSVSHVAPELFGGEPMTARSDVYSAGVTLYHMLTGHYPYGRLSNRDSAPSGGMIPAARYHPDLPPWLEDVLARACDLDPAARFASAGEFAEALAGHGATGIVSTYRAHAGADLTRHASSGPSSRPRWEWLAVGLLIAGLLVYLLFTRR
jgi:protein phosphatase